MFLEKSICYNASLMLDYNVMLTGLSCYECASENGSFKWKDVSVIYNFVLKSLMQCEFNNVLIQGGRRNS